MLPLSLPLLDLNPSGRNQLPHLLRDLNWKATTGDPVNPLAKSLPPLPLLKPRLTHLELSLESHLPKLKARRSLAGSAEIGVRLDLRRRLKRPPSPWKPKPLPEVNLRPNVDLL